MIGKLEELVMLATLKAGPGSLPSAIYEHMVAATPDGAKHPAFGAVYTTITRMSAKGMLTETAMTDNSGRQRKAFTVSAAGQRDLQGAVSHSHALGAYTLAGAF